MATLRLKLTCNFITTCGLVILSMISSAVGNSFSTFIPIITNAKCFGKTVYTITSETTESEFDICIGAAVAGVIIFISVYPFIGLLENDRRKKRSIDLPRKDLSFTFPSLDFELPEDSSFGMQVLSKLIHSSLQGSQFGKKASTLERLS